MCVVTYKKCSECEIFSALHEHPNIVQFIGAEVRSDAGKNEYWIIMQWYERGSLRVHLEVSFWCANVLERIIAEEHNGTGYQHQYHCWHSTRFGLYARRSSDKRWCCDETVHCAPRH